jgi:hypothetical protein
VAGPSSDWPRVKTVFTRAVALPPSERESYLSAVCADAPQIRRDVEALLSSYATSDGFLEEPIDIAAIMGDDEDPEIE